jgi:hypothetical protein
MNLPDLLIIYLACGAPYGVYYFLQNRDQPLTAILWLNSLLRFVFWIPFALQMVARTSLIANLYENGFDKSNGSDAEKERKIEEIKRFLEKKVSQNKLSPSIFEFREVFDRYVGLSVEVQNTVEEISLGEKEIFRLTDHTNKKLGEICLNRRNRLRLVFHQKLARRDFFEICRKLFEISPDWPKTIDQAVRLAALLNDFEARRMFENLSSESLQSAAPANVKNVEQEIWNSDKHKPLTETQISTNLQALTATMKLPGKD